MADLPLVLLPYLRKFILSFENRRRADRELVGVNLYGK
jgi:hypothetical protein